MRIRTVSPDEFYLVLELLEQAFPDVSRSFFHSISQYDPWKHDGFSIAVEVNKKLVSFVQLFDRTMLIQNEEIRFCGIGSVGTHPQHIRKGYASLLLNYARDLMLQEGIAGGMLFTKIHPFYEKLGWKRLPLQEQIISTVSIPYSNCEGYSNRPLKDTDIETVHHLYQQEQNYFPGTLKRTMLYWQKRTHWMNHSCRVIEKDREIVSYIYGAKYRDHIPTLNITEFGLKKHDDQTVSAVLNTAVQLAQENHCTSLCGNFLIHPVFQNYLKENNIHYYESPYHYIMWLDVKPSGAFEMLNQHAINNRFYYWQTDAF